MKTEAKPTDHNIHEGGRLRPAGPGVAMPRWLQSVVCFWRTGHRQRVGFNANPDERYPWRCLLCGHVDAGYGGW